MAVSFWLVIRITMNLRPVTTPGKRSWQGIWVKRMAVPPEEDYEEPYPEYDNNWEDLECSLIAPVPLECPRGEMFGSVGSSQDVSSGFLFTANEPDVAWNGETLGVVWSGSSGSQTQIWYTALNPDLTYAVEPFEITQCNNDCLMPRIAWNGLVYGITWFGEFLNDSHQGIYFKSIDRWGNTHTPVHKVETTEVLTSSVAFNGRRFAVAYTDMLQEVYLALFSEDHLGVERKVRMSNTPDWSNTVDLAYSGNWFGATWRDYNRNTGGWDIALAGMGEGDDQPSAIMWLSPLWHSGMNPSIAGAPCMFGACWVDFANRQDAENDLAHLMFSRFNWDQGTYVEAEFTLSEEKALFWNPQLVFTGNEFGLVVSVNNELAFMRFDIDGNPINGRIDLGIPLNLEDRDPLGITWSGSDYYLTYGKGTIFVRRMGCR